ncbi:MAG: hypothetical protein ACK502_10225 [Alphaproteobacteria bacterium]
MSTARKQYIINDTSVTLESAPDDETPNITLHIDRNSPLPTRDYHKFKLSLLHLLLKSYQSYDLLTTNQSHDTPKSTGFQISYNGNKDETDTKPSPDEFFNIAKNWLDELETNIRTSGDFEQGVALTLRDIQLRSPQPDPDGPDERQLTWSIPNKYNKNEYAIGDVHFRIEETPTDGKYRLSFYEDVNNFPQIAEITDALRKLLVTNFALKDIKISITDDTESGAFNFIIKTDQSLPADDFMHHCDRLVNEVHVNASKQKDVLKGIEVSIELLETTYRNNQRYSIEKALGDAFGKLPSLPEAAKQQVAAIAKELADAVLQPYASIESAIDNIRERKGLSDDAQIRSRLRETMAKYIPPITEDNKAQIKYYVGELANALYVTIPRREAVQGRGG